VTLTLSLVFLSVPCEVTPVRAFYNLRPGSYNDPRGPTGDIGVGLTLCCRAQRLGVAYDVFNGVGMPGLVTCYPALGQWYVVSSVESSCLSALLH
jgi:hypothetical protein